MNKYDKLKSLLTEPVRNIAHSFYDEFVEANVRFRNRAGYKQLIIRRQIAKCCDWCAKLAGIYEYGQEPADVYRRHDFCKCQVTFKTEKGGYVDVHSKKEFDSQREPRKERLDELDRLEKGKNYGRMLKRQSEEDTEAGNDAALKRLRRFLNNNEIDEIKREIVEKILSGKVSLRQKKQKYLQHVQGTTQNRNATRERKREQSILMVSEEEAQFIIYDMCGKGKCIRKGNGIAEYVDLDFDVGQYFEGTEWHKTKRIEISYAKDGTHLFPVKEKENG